MNLLYNTIKIYLHYNTSRFLVILRLAGLKEICSVLKFVCITNKKLSKQA